MDQMVYKTSQLKSNEPDEQTMPSVENLAVQMKKVCTAIHDIKVLDSDRNKIEFLFQSAAESI